MYQNTIIIPAFNPPEYLISYIAELIDNGFDSILLIDDGSRRDKQHIFDSLSKYDEVTVLKHAVNLGKGRALKNAFNHILVYYEDTNQGVITVDSDGQHTIEDIINIQNILKMQVEPALILGTRNFDEEGVPFKSKYGNKITSFVFRMLYGIKITDTQTGLRAIPKEYLYDYCTLAGERFEYEMNMLIYGVENKQNILPYIIKTVYFNKNVETHFQPVIDSLKIYNIILKKLFVFMISSMSSAIIDCILFKIFLTILGNLNLSLRIICATVIARILSSYWNFIISRRIVFHSTRNLLQQAGKYYILCICQMFLSAMSVVFIQSFLLGNELVEKIIVDSLLFFFSYQIQRCWVFRLESSG